MPESISYSVDILFGRSLITIFLAENVGFEPTVPFGITGFQDQPLKPLGQLSETVLDYNNTLLIRCQALFLQFFDFFILGTISITLSQYRLFFLRFLVNYPPPKGSGLVTAQSYKRLTPPTFNPNRHYCLKWRYIIGWLAAPFTVEFTQL